MIELRPYQKELVENIRKSWKKGNKHVLMQMSTGAGKTFCFSYICQASVKKGSNILIITHREELLSQTSGSLVQFGLTPHLINQKTKNPPKYIRDGNVSVAMTGTLKNRFKKTEWKNWFENINLIVLDVFQVFHWISALPSVF